MCSAAWNKWNITAIRHFRFTLFAQIWILTVWIRVCSAVCERIVKWLKILQLYIILLFSALYFLCKTEEKDEWEIPIRVYIQRIHTYGWPPHLLNYSCNYTHVNVDYSDLTMKYVQWSYLLLLLLCRVARMKRNISQINIHAVLYAYTRSHSNKYTIPLKIKPNCCRKAPFQLINMKN